MVTGLVGNNEEQAERLVVNAPLPPSGVDSKLLNVERNRVVFHADMPAILHELDAPVWRGHISPEGNLQNASDRTSTESSTDPLKLPLLPP